MKINNKISQLQQLLIDIKKAYYIALCIETDYTGCGIYEIIERQEYMYSIKQAYANHKCNCLCNYCWNQVDDIVYLCPYYVEKITQALIYQK